ncbi:MAG: division/cell wall cluster transcriptional repressor MraZ [Oscillospiraceae bacterium]|nr:division/cell wall cluster transcriptional repressor MraZ [Oscillospiraceae bacterium]
MYGSYEHTVDVKGRMNFPAKLLKELGEHFYISKSINEKCLTVYTSESWEALRDKLKGNSSKNALAVQRFIFGSACEVEPDKQGRIAIPLALRNYADINGEVVVVGMADRAEIWQKAAWEQYMSDFDDVDLSSIQVELGF